MADHYSYSPDAREFLAGGSTAGVSRLLIVGNSDSEFLDVGEARATQPPEVALASGSYCFVTGGKYEVMVVEAGSPPAVGSRLESPHSEPDHSLSRAYRWYQFFWDSASPLGPSPRFKAGDTALRAGTADYVHIESVERRNGVNRYRVMINGRRQEMTEEGLQELPHDEHDPRSWVQLPEANAKELAVSLTVTKLTNPLTDTVYSYLSSKTVFRSYQFRPVLRMIGSAHQRLLIADEVGLGKTIEAGLIWSELEARGQGLRRVLVVCPAALVQKWRDEMGRRFDRRLTVVDKHNLGEFMDDLERGDNTASLIGVVSLERLRHPKLLADLEELNPRFDLIIVDEAHALRNSGTRSFRLGESLSTWADALIFLSATPLNLGTEDLFNLLNLLVPEDFGNRHIFGKQLEPNRYLNAVAAELIAKKDAPGELLPKLAGIGGCELAHQVTARPEYNDLVELLSMERGLTGSELAEAKRLLLELNTLSSIVSRTRKVDVPDSKAIRKPHSILVDWTPAESELYMAVRNWAELRAKSSGAPPGFAAQMPLRQAASCLPAVIDMIRAKDPAAFITTGDADIEDDFDDCVPFEDFTDESSSDDYEERESNELLATDIGKLLALGDLVEAVGDTDTKFDCFLQALHEAAAANSKQVLVFSFFRRTLEYLYERLTKEGFSARVMHGGVKVDERQHIMNQFRAGEFEILLSSEVGSEGLDFEFCNTIVNYDMPWNPMRVEQRIGRLDRFGQLNDVIFIFNFQVPGTIETDIFDRLYQRINVFESSIGELEPILRDEFTNVARIALDPNLTDAERELQVQQLEVALESRKRELGEIEEASAYLSGIDSLLIEGFEQDTRSRGRFVGPDELRHLLNAYFAGLRGACLIADNEHPDRALLVGDEPLADAVSRCSQTRSGTKYRIAELTARLRDEEPIEVTFSNDDASRNGVELMSLRHPVVQAAVRHFAGLPNGVHRFSSVSVPNLEHPDRSYLTALYLAETSGLRPSLELWPITVRLDNNCEQSVDHDGSSEEAEQVGFALLAAVASGNLEDGQPSDPDLLVDKLSEISDIAFDRQRVVELARQQANDRLIDTRLAARQAGIRYRINAAQDALDKAVSEDRSIQIRRMHRGHIRNLELELSQLPDLMNERRNLSLSLAPVAVAVITGIYDIDDDHQERGNGTA